MVRGKGVGVGTAYSEVTCPRGTGCSGVKCPRTTYSGVNGLGGHFTPRTVSSVTEPVYMVRNFKTLFMDVKNVLMQHGV